MKNIKTKGALGISLIYAVVIGIYNLLVFTISNGDARNNVFWFSYGFVMLAFAVQIVCMLLAFKKADVEAVFFGIPLASFSIFYLGAAIFAGTVFMIFAGIVPPVLAIVVQTVLVGAFIVIAAVTVLSRDVTQHVADNVKQNVVNLKNVLIDVELARDSAENAELKKALAKLCETVKYSDPISTEAVAAVEEKILSRVDDLKMKVAVSDAEGAMLVCRELEYLYAERNKKLSASK
ncbi:MAG: hypothetical protein IJD22_04800 [Clostridia bacterium]|nr:hypothetical protein [Clostridia bacterium]